MMRWLLIVLWVSGSDVEVTRAAFDTEAECQLAGLVLVEVSGADWYSCTKTSKT
jgi:hypothetical protein